MKQKYIRLFNEKIDIPDWVCQEIKNYNTKGNQKINPEIFNFVKDYNPKYPITLYRGMSFFGKSELEDFLKKTRIEFKVGSQGTYKSGSYQSWTTSEVVASDFIGLGDYGVMLESKNINPNNIAIPLSFPPYDIKKKCLTYDQDEIILHPGNYKITVKEIITW